MGVIRKEQVFALHKEGVTKIYVNCPKHGVKLMVALMGGGLACIDCVRVREDERND